MIAPSPVFPWSEEDGLAFVLQSPVLWARCFPHKETRRFVKKRLKEIRSSPFGNRVSIDAASDEGFGDAMLHFLRSARSRRAFAQHLAKEFALVPDLHSQLANVLFEYISNSEFFRDAPELSNAPTSKAAVTDFINWSTQRLSSLPAKRLAVLYACALALRFRDEAQTLYETLLGHDNVVDQLISPELPPSDSVDPQPDIPESPSLATEPTIQPSRAPHSEEVASLGPVQKTASLTKDPNNMIVADARRHVAQPIRGERQFSRRLEFLEQQGQAALERADKILTPWPLREIVADRLRILERLPVPVAVLASKDISDELGGIELNYSRLIALAKRLGKDLPAMQHGTAHESNLTDIATELDHHATALSEQLCAIETAEQSTARVLERLCTIDEPNVPLPPRSDLFLVLQFICAGSPRTNFGAPWKPICDSPEFTGWLLRALLTHDESHTAIASELARSISRPYGEWYSLLNILTQPQIIALATGNDAVAACISACTFAAGFALENRELLDFSITISAAASLPLSWLRLQNEFYRLHLHGIPIGTILAGVSGHKSAAATSHNEGKRYELIQRIDSPVGMDGIYKQLRLRAHSRYIAPLRTHVEHGDAASALAAWESGGDSARKTRDTVRAISALTPHTIDNPHESQTERYIQGFDRDLREWTNLALHALENAQPDELTASWRAFVSEATLSPISAKILEITQALRSPGALPIPAGFGTDILSHLPQDPLRTGLWLSQIRGQEPTTSVVLADLTRALVARAPKNIDEAIEYFLHRRAYMAAEQAASQHPSLASHVAEEIKRRQHSLREDFTLVQKTAEAMLDESDVQLYLDEIKDCESRYEFAQARAAFIELNELLQRLSLRRDPHYISARKFVSELGVTTAPDLPILDLLAIITSYKQERAGSRGHIIAIQEYSTAIGFPRRLQEELAQLLPTWDWPRYWPKQPNAEKLARTVRTLLRSAHTLYTKYRSYHEDEMDELCELIPPYLSYQFQLLFSGSSNPALEQMEQLANEIEDGCPVSRILVIIKRTNDFGRPRMDSSVQSRRSFDLRRRAGVGADSILHELHAEIVEYMHSEQIEEIEPEARTLRSFAAEDDWKGLCAQAAADWLCKPQDSPGGLSPLLAAYIVARTLRMLPDVHDAREAMLRASSLVSVIVDRSLLKSVFADRYIDEVFGRAIASVADRNRPSLYLIGNDEIQEDLGRLLKDLGEQGIGEGGSLRTWLAEILASASQFELDGVPGSALLGLKLWDLFTDKIESHQQRSHLLFVLFTLHHSEALRALARQRGPLDEILVAAIDAFAHGEADDNMRIHALQLSSAYRQQAASRANAKPWTMLLMRLEAPEHARAEAPLRCLPDTDTAEDSGEGRFLLQFRVEPQLHDPPAQLRMEIGDQILDLVPRDEVLWRAKVEAIEVPLEGDLHDGDLVEVPYKITGATICGEPIDIRNSFTLTVARGAQHALSGEDLQRSWPGATGEPVSVERGFVGRKRELREIERILRADDRQRSLMLIGQRRIGKTSLLLELVRSFPPGPGTIAGVFVDVAGLELPPGSSMQSLFFKHLIESIRSHKANALLHHELLETTTEKHLWRALRNQQTESSFALALEQLVARISDVTRGRVTRLAFFIDEFDRFVEPWLSGRRDEADKLMWNIRQVAQQSECVSLVLAGSGLQQLFTRHYADALYGSIEQIELGPFDIEQDYEHVRDTFLPLSVRRHISQETRLPELIKHAAYLCKGHPYYLALLGYSATLLSKGRRISQPRLHLAIEAMIRGDVKGSSRRVDAELFFSHFFETWKRLPLRDQAIARCLLAHLAQKTTLEYPWLSLDQAINAPELQRRTSSEEREKTMQVLVDEGAVEQEGGFSNRRVRIRVPITAMALQFSAVKVRQEAIRDIPAQQ